MKKFIIVLAIIKKVQFKFDCFKKYEQKAEEYFDEVMGLGANKYK